MTTITQLTPSQREALFTLVRYQKRHKKEIAFFGPLSGSIKLKAMDMDDEVLTEVQAPTIEIWEKCHYVSSSSSHGSVIPAVSLVLRQEAFDYASFMSKPAPLRLLIRFWNWMVADMPAFLWGILGAIIIQVISNLLGF